jgi:hypothetical protein
MAKCSNTGGGKGRTLARELPLHADKGHSLLSRPMLLNKLGNLYKIWATEGDFFMMSE